MARSSCRFVMFATIAIALCGTMPITLVSAKQNCGDDLGKLAASRGAALKVLSDIVKLYQGQALPPEIFCPSFVDLQATETPLLTYMIKYKDLCKIPESSIEELRDAITKTLQFGQKYCP